MKVLILARATLYSVYGGDTLQIVSTAKYLRMQGVDVDIKLANEQIEYGAYDLMHIFNATRPADVLVHINNSKLPFVLSTIFVDYSDYQKAHARGLLSLLNKLFSSDQLEYIKAIARRIKNGEKVNSAQYLYKGHKRSIQMLAEKAACLLPNSESEYKRFVASYGVERPYKVIHNGVDPEIFDRTDEIQSLKADNRNVICVARIEGKKNQLNLIKALNDTEFNLKIIGKPAPNHTKYYEACKKIASKNISFENFIPQEHLIDCYLAAKVHILPSWNETCGLSSLEAAYYNCNLVITDKGDTVDYFGDDAWYCDPGNPQSIYEAVVKASAAPSNECFREKIINIYNWKQAALQTLDVYKEVLNKKTEKVKTRTTNKPKPANITQ